MNKSKSKSAANALRHRGIPRDSGARPLKAEMRSDTPLPGIGVVGNPNYTLHMAIVLWEFRLSWPDATAFFTDFLSTKEQALFDQLQTLNGPGQLMDGVQYRGTYLGLIDGHACYRTLWGYLDPSHADTKWQAVLDGGATPNLVLHDAMLVLRRYWLKDPARTENRFHIAKPFGDFGAAVKAKSPFLALTVAAGS